MTPFDKTIIKGGLAGLTLVAVASANAVTVGTFDNTTLKIGGYIKLDALLSSYSDGSLAAGSIGRDFYVPSVTPVGGNEENRTFDMHAKQSRFHIATNSVVGEHKLNTFLEFDFMATQPNGNERVSNSYVPRMRQAYLTYDNWLFGQTWSTFQNVASLPETVDFIGNTDFGIFIRQAQVRYTMGNLEFAAENPETTITPYGGGTQIVADDNEWPDLVGRYNYKKDDLSLVAAVLARQLTYNNGTTIDDTTTSYGLSLTGKLMVGNKDDVRFGINTGSGMGRYIGLNVSNGAVLNASGSLEAIDSTAFYAAYRHFWDAKWRSNFTYSEISIDNDTSLTGTGATKGTSSFRVNLFYAATDKLVFGGEYAHANRELESGADGNMDRFQFTAKLDF